MNTAPCWSKDSELCREEADRCKTISCQIADVCVPISLKPETTVGSVTVECHEEPTVRCFQHGCGGRCEIVVTQRVQIRIPIEYRVTVRSGESSIYCGSRYSTD